METQTTLEDVLAEEMGPNPAPAVSPSEGDGRGAAEASDGFWQSRYQRGLSPSKASQMICRMAMCITHPQQSRHQAHSAFLQTAERMLAL